FTRDFFQRVGDARLLLTQLQADALQPCLRQVATVFDDGSVPGEDHQIVRVSDDLGLPMELLARVFRVPSRPGWKVRANKLFESVQREVRQQWRPYTPYKVASPLLEFSTSIPRTQLRPSYGEGFLGAPLQPGTRRDPPMPLGQGDDRGPSRTSSPSTPGDSEHV